MTRATAMRYLFGPVNSRRLGRSLGIDLLPFKTCSLDCIYCECGWTTQLTTRRHELLPTDAVIAELDAFLASSPELDYLTFSGAGEPTLHTGIGRVIEYLKERHPRYRIAVLSNGTLLGDPAVANALQRADLVVPSLDGATPESFAAICRPAAGITVQAVIDGIASFRRGFAGLLLLEIFIVPGINDSADELRALKAAAVRIAPDAIQLNTLDRRGADPGVTVADSETLERIRAYFAPLQVQAVRRRGKAEAPPWEDARIFAEVLAAIDNGASDLHRIALATGLRVGDLAKILAEMARQGRVTSTGSRITARRIAATPERAQSVGGS